MKGFWNWTSNAISNTASAIKQTASLVMATASTIKTVYDYIRDPAKNFLSQTVKGFLGFWQFDAAMTVIESKKIRPVVGKALAANGIYLGLAVLFELTRKQLPQLVPAVENTAIEWGASSVIFALDAFALLYMLKRYSAAYVDNTCDNAAISKVIYDEVPSTTNHPNKCEHGYMAQFQAGCASTFYYLGKIFAVWNVENAAYRYVPVLGATAAWPLKVFATGETLVEYKLSSLGNCTECRYEKLSFNNGYSFGMGLALCGSYEVVRFLFNKCLGLQNSFLTDAVFNMLFQCSIIAALMNDKPLPGKVDKTRIGVEVFWPMRVATETWMTRIGAKIVALYSRPDQGIDIEKQVQQAMDCPPVLLTRKAIIDENIQSENIVKRESFLRAYNMYVKQVKDYATWLIDVRKDPIKNKFPTVTDYLPIPDSLITRATNGYNKAQVDLAFDARLDQLLVLVNRFIKFVDSKNGREFIKQYNDKLLNEVIQQQLPAPVTMPAIERKVEPEKFLPPEPTQAPQAATPKDEPPKQRRPRVDRFLAGLNDAGSADGLAGNVRLSSSGMFRRSNLAASNTASQLSASRQAPK